MSIPVTCSSCQYHFAVPPEFAGKRGKCPKCGMIIVAPAAAGAPAAAAPAKPAAPPMRLKTAAPLEPAAAAPARPAPRPAAAPAPAPLAARPSDTSRPSDTTPSFNFDAAPSAGPRVAAPSSVTARRPTKKASNTGLLIGLGAGGGVAVVALVIALVVGLSGGSDKPIADAGKQPSVANSIAGTKKDKPAPTDDGKSLYDQPRERKPVEVVAARPREALSLEDVVDGVVKIESPGIGGIAQGTGFIINEKGWIATNCHVIDDATDQTRVIIRNSPYKVAGLIIKAPEHDMAIIKLAEQPFQLTVLDISYSQHPKLASKVRAIGFPSNTFNLTEGIVSNVTTVDGLANQGQKAFLREMHADPNHLWIQHSAKISPGNSGGPLLNEQNQVIGINTWVSSDIDVGYAGHINHLRDLIAQARDTVTPFPKGVGVEIAEGDELQNTVFTVDRVQQLVGFCSKFQWKPSTVDEFNAMAELAKLITLAALAPPGRLDSEMKAATDQAVQVMSKLSWDADQIAKVNQFAADATNKPLHGMVFVATMIEPNAKFGDNAIADRLKLEGSDRHVIVKGKSNKAIAGKDARVLVIGLNMPALITADENTEAQRLIVPGFSRELQK